MVMAWNDRNYPVAMRTLPGELRTKAIEMANVLHEEQGFHQEQAIEMAIERARMWAARRHTRELVREGGSRRSRRGLARPSRRRRVPPPRPPHNSRPPIRSPREREAGR